MTERLPRISPAYVPLVIAGQGLTARVGSGPGEAVLWLHDYALDSSVFAELWECLPGWHHVAVDLPGHGISLPPEAHERLAQIAARVNEVAEAHDVRHVVGIGLGAVIALQMTIEKPDSYESCVLVSPWCLADGEESDLFAFHRDLMTLFQLDGFGPDLRERMMGAESGPYRDADSHPELRARFRRLLGRHGWWELRDGWILSLFSHSQTAEEIGRVEARTLALVGNDAPAAQKRHAASICASNRNSAMVEVTGTSGRLGMLEDPGAIRDIIERHFVGKRRAAAVTAG